MLTIKQKWIPIIITLISNISIYKCSRQCQSGTRNDHSNNQFQWQPSVPNAHVKVEQLCNLTAPMCQEKYDSIEHQGHCIKEISQASERKGKKKSSTKRQIRPGVWMSPGIVWQTLSAVTNESVRGWRSPHHVSLLFCDKATCARAPGSTWMTAMAGTETGD